MKGMHSRTSYYATQHLLLYGKLAICFKLVSTCSATTQTIFNFVKNFSNFILPKEFKAQKQYSETSYPLTGIIEYCILRSVLQPLLSGHYGCILSTQESSAKMRTLLMRFRILQCESWQ